MTQHRRGKQEGSQDTRCGIDTIRSSTHKPTVFGPIGHGSRDLRVTVGGHKFRAPRLHDSNTDATHTMRHTLCLHHPNALLSSRTSVLLEVAVQLIAISKCSRRTFTYYHECKLNIYAQQTMLLHTKPKQFNNGLTIKYLKLCSGQFICQMSILSRTLVFS